MRYPIAGVIPPDLEEADIMKAWPSIGAHWLGRWVGRLCSSRLGVPPLTLGHVMALVTIPVSVAVYCWIRMPGLCRRYTVTNRRLIIGHGWRAVDRNWINLDEFDAIEVVVLPGQAWLHCGDIVFRRGQGELLRFSGVQRPEVFRQACLKSRNAAAAIGRVLRQQRAEAAPAAT